MQKTFTDTLVSEMLALRAPAVKTFQKCSFITPSGKFFKIVEHYEIYKFLVIEGLVPCIPDAEELLDSFGYIRYSWIGYMTLSTKTPTAAQYDAIEYALVEISKYRDSICIQLQASPRDFVNYDLDDIPYIIDRIKKYYELGRLLI